MFYCSENELINVKEALNSSHKRLPISQLASGSVPLFGKGFFTWGALPYPKEHAELAWLLFQSEEPLFKEIALKMMHFQMATLDHNQKPLYALYAQEGRLSQRAIEEASEALLESLIHPFPNHCNFLDQELGMVIKRNQTSTLACLSSGCKSGMGSFLHLDGGIINFAPHLLPVVDPSGFGLAGKGKDVLLEDEEKGFKLSYSCAIAAPCLRKCNVFNLWDSGLSGLWVRAALEGNLNELKAQFDFDGYRPLEECVVSFFGKAKKCVIAGSHHLSPRSLDRYSGPVQKLAFYGEEGGVTIESAEGFNQMQVFPLAGDENFWGADFLAVYKLYSKNCAFIMRASSL